jgi:hypothetical protein
MLIFPFLRQLTQVLPRPPPLHASHPHAQSQSRRKTNRDTQTLSCPNGPTPPAYHDRQPQVHNKEAMCNVGVCRRPEEISLKPHDSYAPLSRKTVWRP